MCGRYFVDDDTSREIRQLVRMADPGIKFHAGDVYPSGLAAVISGKNPGFRLERMHWGLVRQDKKGLLINARAETVLEKKMFRSGVQKRRCTIPARGFYEWDREKNRVSFYQKDHRIMYMAGFYNSDKDGDHFIILTTQANDSVRPVHHRMPLLLEKEELDAWVYDEDFLGHALGKIPPGLKRVQEYEQLSLF